MPHITPESNGRATTAPAEDFGRPKVLVVAYPDLADAVYEALGLIAPPPAPSAGAAREPVRTVSTLCSQVFPARVKAAASAPAPGHTFKEGLMQGLMRLFGVAADEPTIPAQKPSKTEDLPVSLFEWGDYDFVVIQDMWAGLSDSGAPTLEPAGYELAHLDYYERGNFNTKKIVLVTDDEFLVRKWKHTDGGKQEGAETVDLQQLVRLSFDEKDAFPLVYLSHPNALKQLREAVFDSKEPLQAAGSVAAANAPQTEAYTPTVQRTAPGPNIELRSQVRQAIAGALRLYIKSRAEIVFVDDELEELRNTFREVAGEELSDGGGTQVRQSKSVYIVDTKEKMPSPAEYFDQLVELCEGKFDEALGGGEDYVLFVTDILFKLTSWEQTGIDLIQQLRQQLSYTGTGLFGIVAFTGFTTPFIVMSAYQRGADFVVPKISRGKHDIDTAGTDRLLMTLAVLCFQKTFLRAKRMETRLCNDSDGSARASSDKFARSLRHLQAVIPQHTVSMHLQQEWLDTCYLLDAMTIYKPGSPILERALREVSDKYA